MKTVQLNVRVKKELKEEVEKLAESAGLALSDIVNMSFAKIAKERKLDISFPKKIRTQEDLLKHIKNNSIINNNYKSGLDLQNKVRG